MNKKYLNLLGLANVAKGIVSGETLIKSIAANETKLVVIANDASANTKKKITDKCHFYHVDYFIVDENIETNNIYISYKIVNYVESIYNIDIKIKNSYII